MHLDLVGNSPGLSAPGPFHSTHLQRLLYSIQLLLTLLFRQLQLLLQGLDFSFLLIHLPLEIFHLDEEEGNMTKRILKWLFYTINCSTYITVHCLISYLERINIPFRADKE